MLMRAAAKEHKWNLNYGAIASIWRGGCIIRSVFLGKIKEAFDARADLPNLLLDPFFKSAVTQGQRRLAARGHHRDQAGHPGADDRLGPVLLRRLSSRAAAGQPAPGPARLLRRHTYERVDKPRGQFFHTNWTGRGGTTAASTYVV